MTVTPCRVNRDHSWFIGGEVIYLLISFILMGAPFQVSNKIFILRCAIALTWGLIVSLSLVYPYDWELLENLTDLHLAEYPSFKVIVSEKDYDEPIILQKGVHPEFYEITKDTLKNVRIFRRRSLWFVPLTKWPGLIKGAPIENEK